MGFYNIQAEEEATHGLNLGAGYVDANGNGFASYEDACRYYGADTPAQLEEEEAYYASLSDEELANPHADDGDWEDEIPF